MGWISTEIALPVTNMKVIMKDRNGDELNGEWFHGKWYLPSVPSLAMYANIIKWKPEILSEDKER